MVQSVQAAALFWLLTRVFWFELDWEAEPSKKLVPILDDPEVDVSAIHSRYSAF